MFLLTETSRAHSRGYENYFKKAFNSLEEAATYIHDVWYDQFCQEFSFPEDWDKEDMGGADFPKKETFAPEVIISKMKGRRLTLFDYYSDFCFLVPNELVLEKI